MLDDSAPPPYFPPDQPKVDLSQSNPPPTFTPAPLNLPDMLDLPSLPAVPVDTPLDGNTPQVCHLNTNKCFNNYFREEIMTRTLTLMT